MNNKQKAFTEEYLIDFNATQAALRVGYSPKTAYSIGQENLKKPEIKAAIEARIAEKAMSADEVLIRLANMARGDIGNFASIENSSDLARHPQSYLVKKYKKRIYRPKNSDPYEEIELEIYDAHAPLVDIGKHHAIFTDKVEHSGEVTTGPINIIVEMPKEQNET